MPSASSLLSIEFDLYTIIVLFDGSMCSQTQRWQWVFLLPSFRFPSSSFVKFLYISLFIIPIVLFALIVYYTRPQHRDYRSVTIPAMTNKHFPKYVLLLHLHASRQQMKENSIMPAILETQVEEPLDSPLTKREVYSVFCIESHVWWVLGTVLVWYWSLSLQQNHL